jgi:hypothetical protein
MGWKIELHLDEAHDVVTAHFEGCVLETPEDVERWRRETEQRLRAYGRKVDLLINLDGLVVKVGAGRAFGLARREVLEQFASRSYRFGGDPLTRSFISTSGMITGADVNAYANREEALKALLAARARARRNA